VLRSFASLEEQLKAEKDVEPWSVNRSKKELFSPRMKVNA
jgi:hypothetical protein